MCSNRSPDWRLEPTTTWSSRLAQGSKRCGSKLEADLEHPEFILTDRGTGYLFRRLLQPAH